MNHQQLERIAFYEEKLDRCTEVLKVLRSALEQLDGIKEDLDALEEYYTGPQWKKDFEDDEAGKIPAEVKRGVLSEDGIDTLLNDVRELKEHFCTETE